MNFKSSSKRLFWIHSFFLFYCKIFILGQRIRVFAVEKNPNAVITLQHQQLELWGDQVTVISSDMRDWNPDPEDYADILVSELLGSFGDNELSPECLDGAQKFLKPGGISIPCSYTSYI